MVLHSAQKISQKSKDNVRCAVCRVPCARYVMAYGYAFIQLTARSSVIFLILSLQYTTCTTVQYAVDSGEPQNERL